MADGRTVVRVVLPHKCSMIVYARYKFEFYDDERVDPEGWGLDEMIPNRRKKGPPKGKTVVDPDLMKQGLFRQGFSTLATPSCPSRAALAVWAAKTLHTNITEQYQEVDSVVRYLKNGDKTVMEIPIVGGVDAEAWRTLDLREQIFRCVAGEEIKASVLTYPHIAIIDTELAAEPKEQVDAKMKSDRNDVSDHEVVVPAEHCESEVKDDDVMDYFTVHGYFVMFHHRNPRTLLFEPAKEWIPLLRPTRITYGFWEKSGSSFHNVDDMTMK